MAFSLYINAAEGGTRSVLALGRRITKRLTCALLLTCPAVVLAQGPVDGAIRGHVTEVCGPYPHPCAATSVHIHLTSSDLDVARDVDADRDGNFLILRLPPGEYQVRAISRLPDHSVAVTTFDLQGGDFDDVSMTLGSAHNHTVTTSPGLHLTTFEVQARESALPIESRQWENLVELDSTANEDPAAAAAASGTASDSEGNASSRRSGLDGAGGAGISYAGLPATQGKLSVDGLSANQSFRSGPRGAASDGATSGSSYSQGSVRSFRVLPRDFSAQYGTLGGMAVVTRAASSALHGNAFFLARESGWAAANPFSIETHYRNGVVTSDNVKPAGSLLQFGGSAGAPLTWRPRGGPKASQHKGSNQREPMSVFASIEVLLHNDHIVSTPELPTFYSLSADQMALLTNRGVSYAATNTALNYLDSLTGTTARSAYRVQGSVRFDVAPTTRDQLTLTYAANRYDALAGTALGQASDAVVSRGTGSLGDSVVDVDAVTGRWAHTFSSRLNNEVRSQFARDLDYEKPHTPLAQEPAIGPGGYAPEVAIAPYGFSYGTPTSMSPGASGGHGVYPDETRFELADTMQFHMGRHLIMLGADWSRIHDTIDALSAQEGAFNYDSGTTNGSDGGLVDWITDYTFNVNAYPNGGCPSIIATVHYFCFRSFRQSFGELDTKFVTHNIAGFAEDRMRVRNNLTVTLGVRYDYTLLPRPQAPNPLLDADIVEMGGTIHGATNIFPEDRNNIGPRVSMAWSPRTLWGLPARWSRSEGTLFTMHLGYGVFYGKIPGATVRAALTDTALNPALDSSALSTMTHIRIRPQTITDCPQVTAIQQGFGYPCDYTSAPPAAVVQTTSAMVFASNYRLPVVQRGTISVERQMGKRASVQLSFTTAEATQLPASTDINIAPSKGLVSYQIQVPNGHKGLVNGQIFEVPLYQQRPMLNFGAVTALESNANATYNAFTAEARTDGLHWRGLRTLELRGSYTFSRSIDYAPQNSAIPQEDTQFDPFHNGYDKGLSDQQFPQHFAGTLIYPIRIRSGPALVRRALDGWHISAIGIGTSGQPYSYKIFGGTYLAGGRHSINGSGGAAYLPTIGRNTLSLAPQGTVDLRLNREMSVGSRLHLNGFAEAFNLLNAVNITGVETRAFEIGNPTTIGNPIGTIGNPTATGPTPLIFQDAAQIATEGLTTAIPFGTPDSSTSTSLVSRERQVELGVRLQF
ncbi:MAG: TonB-dependent receptor [Acidobacteria bacterium]|nr:TonB-dependent receptor [Acidobacteriota bacterium]